jgi:hypothetical protein
LNRERQAASKVARVGVIVDDGAERRDWAQAVVDSLDVVGLECTCTYLVPGGTPRPLPYAVSLYGRLDRLLSRRWTRRAGASARPGTEVNVSTDGRLPAADTPASHRLDAVIDLRAEWRAAPWGDDGVARLGIEFAGEPDDGYPLLFRSLADGRHTTTIRATGATPAGRADGEDAPLESTVALVPGSVCASQLAAARESSVVLGRAVRRFAGARPSTPGAPPPTLPRGDGVVASGAPPGPRRAALRLTAERIGSTVRRRLEKVWIEQWVVGLRTIQPGRGPASPEGYELVDPPPGRGYADPFLAQHGGRTYLFVEDIDLATGRGAIAVMEVFPDGRTSVATTVLERPYHLSYPNVFEDGGEWYMIPESASNDTIELYRSKRFPYDWEPPQVIMAGLRARDATVMRARGAYWLFCALETPPGGRHQDLAVFTSDHLLGPWREHPSNPVVSDVRRARPAGAFLDLDGDLVRPAQDCAVRYGGEVVFNRVLHLDGERYAEEALARLGPQWHPGLLATHTYNRAGGFEAVDGVLRRRR